MSIKIRLSHPDLSEQIHHYNHYYASPSKHALSIIEELCPEEADKGEIYSDGSR